MRRLTLTYKDKETGAVLHGFSQVDLDKLNRNIEINNKHLADYKKLLIFLSVMMFLMLMFGVWLVWYFHHYNILGNIIEALR